MSKMFSEIDHPNPAPLNEAEGPPLVDITVVTYNHERLVAQAIESVLAQRTDFKYRLIIGDDCSTDDTPAIIRRYAEEYSDRIKIVFDSEHRGLTHKDRVGMKLMTLSTAKYLALLDGDDYWTDPYKLQKQVDFLESHPECAICFHNVLRDDGSSEPRAFCPPDHREISTLDDLLSGNFMHTCSVVFRRGLFDRFPDWYFTSVVGDWPLHIFNAQHGNIGYINEVMATYRVHAGGAWSSKPRSRQLLDSIDLLDQVDKYLNFSFKDRIGATKAGYYYQLAVIYRNRGHLLHARRALKESILCWGFKPQRIRSLLFSREPSILGRFGRLKGFLRRSSSQSKST